MRAPNPAIARLRTAIAVLFLRTPLGLTWLRIAIEPVLRPGDLFVCRTTGVTRPALLSLLRSFHWSKILP